MSCLHSDGAISPDDYKRSQVYDLAVLSTMTVSADSTFSSVPILDYNLLLSSTTRASFVEQLQHALVSVGFFYLANPPVPPELIAGAAEYAAKFFEIPQEAKNAINMRNSESFLGYTRLGAERTKGRRDEREQFDFATDYAKRNVKTGDPPYLRLWGPSQVRLRGRRYMMHLKRYSPLQWPDDTVLPGFKDTLRRYLDRVESLSYEIMSLSAEALGLSPNAFEPLFGDPGTVMHRAKAKQTTPGYTNNHIDLVSTASEVSNTGCCRD